MYPHERSLVKRLKDQPFALLGINSDEDLEQLREVVQQEELVWRSWWDGGIDGPIHKQWQVTLRPATYVLDARGIVRYKNVFEAELDAAVDTLLEEMDTAASDAE